MTHKRKERTSPKQCISIWLLFTNNDAIISEIQSQGVWGLSDLTSFNCNFRGCVILKYNKMYNLQAQLDCSTTETVVVVTGRWERGFLRPGAPKPQPSLFCGRQAGTMEHGRGLAADGGVCTCVCACVRVYGRGAGGAWAHHLDATAPTETPFTTNKKNNK